MLALNSAMKVRQHGLLFPEAKSVHMGGTTVPVPSKKKNCNTAVSCLKHGFNVYPEIGANHFYITLAPLAAKPLHLVAKVHF